jgi:hypothetical protein
LVKRSGLETFPAFGTVFDGRPPCHIVPPGKQEVLVVSLTQVHVPRAMPLAATVADYQKHRVKKLKKQGRP